MTILGDFFPSSNIDSFAKSVIVVQSVLKFFTYETNPPKEKRFVIIGESEKEVGLLFINSILNTKVHKVGTHTYNLQTPVNKHCNCAYLDYDSFVDCTRIYPYQKSFIISTVSNNLGTYLGKMEECHWNDVYEAVKNSVTISRKIKQNFGIL